MENIFHAKEEEGYFFGDFSYMSEGVHAGSFEANCSQACPNIILQKEKFTDGLAVILNDQAVEESIEALQIRQFFSIPQSKDMMDLLLVNWKEGQLGVFGSLIALYHVLEAEGLNLLPLTDTCHPAVLAVCNQLESARGYLYFLNNHWMVFRQIGKHWYKFDPWLGGAQIYEHSYVALYIKQLIKDGMLVFLIDGDFPVCPADLVNQEPDIPECLLESEPFSHNELGTPAIDMSEMEIAEGIRLLDLVFEGEDNELAYACLISLEDEIRRKKVEEEFERLTNIIDASSSTQNTEGAVNAKRKNGTSVTPVIGLENTCTSSANDHSQPFDIIINEKGDGVNCLDKPVSASIPAAHSSNFEKSGRKVSAPSESHPVGSPRVLISSSHKSTLTKVISGATEGIKAGNDEKEEEMCCICWAVAPSHVVVPCGHFCLCSECVVSIQKPDKKTQCPMCKQETTLIVKLYK